MDPPRRRRRNKRAAILSAVTNAIASQGVRGMRVEQVAAEAGVSVALLYYHFHSRLELARAALRHAYERAPSTGALDVLPSGTPAFDALEAALLAELDEAPDVRRFSIVWGELAASAVFEPSLRPDVQDVCHSWSDDVARAITAGIADGSIQPEVDPDTTAQVLTTLVDGLCARWLAGVLELGDARAVLRAALRRELLGTWERPVEGAGAAEDGAEVA